MNTALITGAAGFIAGHLATVVRAAMTARVVGIDVRDMPERLFDQRIHVDLTDPEATQRAVRSVRPNTVFHLAGAVRGTEELLYSSNVTSACILLDTLLDIAPGARVVLVGSAAEYGIVPLSQQPVAESFAGTPVSAYGRAKTRVSTLAKTAASRDQRVIVVRPFNVLGAGSPDTLVGGAIVDRLWAAIAAPEPRTIRIGRTSTIRDFVAVEDVARGMLLAAREGRPGEAYNLCSGEGHSIAELLDRLLTLAGTPVAVEEDSSLIRQDDVDAMVGSRDKAKHELGWEPLVPFDLAVRATWRGAQPGQRLSNA